MEDLLYLHYDGQCPWHLWMKKRVENAASELECNVEIVDLTRNPEVAEQYRVFFPFMTIIRDEIRTPGPVPARELVRMAREGMESSKTVRKPLKPEGHAQTLFPLTVENVCDTCRLCNYDTAEACKAKREWACLVKKASGTKIIGFISYEGDEPVGAIEFIPAPLVPYPLPEKTRSTAFITCVYSREDDVLDYRGQVLKHLIGHLPTLGYERVQVISGRRTAYPNGPAPLFNRHGFTEVSSAIFSMRQDEQLLMERDLRTS
jgi:hypothetical protein